MTIKYSFKALPVSFLLAFTLLVSSCASILPQQEKEPKAMASLQVELNQYKQSAFKEVEAKFFTRKSKDLVFRVLSNVDQTPQWLDRVDSLEILTVYNNHQYLLRTIIDSPWPFKSRELITCVNTYFDETVTTIKIFSCSDRVPVDDRYVRLSQVKSSWTIKEISTSLVEINYKTWLDPSGNVPAFIFNSELIDNAEISLKKLQIIIENSLLEQYSY
jgi:hypothetical protein